MATRSKAWVCGRFFAAIVGLNPAGCMDDVLLCYMLKGRGLCDELITRAEEYCRVWCVVVCDLETSRIRRHWTALGWNATGKNRLRNILRKVMSSIVCNLEGHKILQDNREEFLTDFTKLICWTFWNMFYIWVLIFWGLTPCLSLVIEVSEELSVFVFSVA